MKIALQHRLLTKGYDKPMPVLNIMFFRTFLDGCNFEDKDAFSIEIKNDNLHLKYVGKVGKLARTANIVKLHGTQIRVSFKRLPELHAYVLPEDKQVFDAKILGDELLVNLSHLPKKTLVFRQPSLLEKIKGFRVFR